MRIRNGLLASSLVVLIGLFLLPNKRRVLTLPIDALLRESTMRGLSFKNKRKGKVCKSCKFDFICDALWKDYIKKYGLDELIAQEGRKITEPFYFL